jgi:RHS repeat-associated protein
LITQITYNSTNYTQTRYTAGGQKLRSTVVTSGLVSKTTDYVGNFVYENGELAYISNATGRITVTKPKTKNAVPPVNEPYFNYFREYYIKDYQGNICVTFDQNGTVLQETAYHPFGLSILALSYSASQTPLDFTFSNNKYQYNGYETQTDFNLGWIDYGFRQLDPVLGVWHGLDKMAEKYPDVSPYAYCGNDPVNRTDFMGLEYPINLRDRGPTTLMRDKNPDSFNNVGGGIVLGYVPTKGSPDFEDLYVEDANGNWVRRSECVDIGGGVMVPIDDVDLYINKETGQQYTSSELHGHYTTNLAGDLFGINIYGVGSISFDGSIKAKDFFGGEVSTMTSALNSITNSGQLEARYPGIPIFRLDGLERGVTIPGIGIFVPAKGTKAYTLNKGEALVEHEYGHFIQFVIHGAVPFFAGASQSILPLKNHMNQPFEREASTFALIFFGADSKLQKYSGLYPTDNINNYNTMLVSGFRLFIMSGLPTSTVIF